MMKFVKHLRFLFNIRKSIPFLVEYFRSREVSPLKKVVSIGLGIGYLLFPFDIIPDVLVFFGIVDDVAVFTFILQFIVKLAPEELKERYDIKRL